MKPPGRGAPVPPAPTAPSAGQTLAFVTGNHGKVTEMAALLAPLGWSVVADGRGYPEVQADTLAEVTEAGARHLLASGLRPPFILEDSGLFVDALRGFPGVYSRYVQDTVGLEGLLRLLRETPAAKRTARFETDVAYVDGGGGIHHFAGSCPGHIAPHAAGTTGFGFDPLFIPTGHTQTFAEMGPARKNRLSHRARAAAALARHLGAS